MKTLLIILCILLFPCVVAAVTVNSTTGTWTHGGPVTINGSSFGTKSPAAPRIWDACDSASTNDMDTYWPGQRLPSCAAGSDGDANVSTLVADYRTVYPDLGGTPMGMPHSRITKYIASGQSTCGGSWGSTCCSDLGFTTGSWGVGKLFAMYYYRVSPTYSQETAAEGDNFKELNANGGDGTMYAGSDNYTAFCTSGSPPVPYPSDAEMPAWISGESRYGCGHVIGMMPNPMGTWLHWEWLWDANESKFAFSDNSARRSDYFGTTSNNINTDGNPPVSITVGGFNRWPRASATGNYRYWAALYLDDTYSRVMLGNASTWANCTVREPQIPSAWSTGEITVEVNLGALTGTTGYLYVFDSTNTCNSTGYTVTLDQEGEITTTSSSSTTTTAPVIVTTTTSSTSISTTTSVAVTTTSTTVAPSASGVTAQGVNLELGPGYE